MSVMKRRNEDLLQHSHKTHLLWSLASYCRRRRAALLLYGLMALFFPLIQYLYALPLAPVGYAMLVITFLILPAAVIDCSRYARQTRALLLARENLPEAVRLLPPPIDPLEAEYREILLSLYELLQTQTETLARRHEEQVAYYTMWVHQIKTPIAAALLEMEGPARAAVLEAELFKIERYVEMALHFVKMDDLSGDLVLGMYPLEPIVKAAVRKYAPLFIAKKLSATIEDVDFSVETDSKWLSFILEQVLSNAVKYTETGGVLIRGDGKALWVKDTGIGIVSEDLARVFHKGYTGFNGRMDKRASGLGLYMAKRVSDQLGIRLQLQSAPGQGTHIALTFPQHAQYIQ